MLRLALVVVCLSSNLIIIEGQNNLDAWTSIGPERGLSDRTIKDIIRDHYGYLWIATRNGLNRYDGLDIVSYTTNPKSQTRINSKNIKKIAAGTADEILVQYEANRRFIDVITPEATVAHRLYFNEEQGVTGLVEYIELNHRTGRHHVLVSHGDTLTILKLNQELTLEPLLSLDFEKKDHANYRLMSDPRGTYWINDDQEGFINFDSLGRPLSKISYDTLGVDKDVGLANIFHRDRLGRFWLSFSDTPGLWEYNEAAALFKPVDDDEISTKRYYTNLWEDALGNVLIAQKTRKQDFRTYLHLFKSDDAALPYDHVLMEDVVLNVVFSRDFERLIFLGTDSGVKKVNLTKKHVKTFLTSQAPRESSVSLRGITATSDGKIVIGRNIGDWFQYDPVSESIKTIEIDLKYSNGAQFYPSPKQLLTDHDGNIWGSGHSFYGGQLIRYQPSDSSFVSYETGYRIQSMIMGQDSQIWIVTGGDGTDGDLSWFDLGNKSLHHYFNADQTKPLQGTSPTYLYQSRDGIMWVGSTTGIHRISIPDGQSQVISSSPDEYDGLVSNLIYCITEDQEGNLWIGTDAGVNIYDPVTESFSHYNVKDGLADNNICGILEDGKGNFWLSTYGGLSYFDRQLNSFRNFGKADGFSHNRFNRFSFYSDTLSNMYFGGVNGLNVFNANDLLERDLDAPILLSEVSYYDKEEGAIVQHLHNLQNLSTVRLAASNRYFRCRFAMADYAYPQLNRFRYKLDGQDIDWNYIGTQNELTFNNLTAGDYVLRIVGTDRNLNLSSREFSLNIRVEEYFYRKSWFVAFCIFLILLAIYLYHRIKLQQAINMERLRTKISSDLHDDVGGVLSGLAMQTELLEYSAKDSDKPKLKRISEMSRNAMAQMRDVIWATDARKDKFEDLLIRMKEFAAEMLFPKRIICEFKVENIYKEKKIPVQVRQNLYLIFKEAITNVAKHSDATQVLVNFTKEGSRFKMTIRDNGQKKDLNGKTISSLNGSGLKNIQMRAKHINADLKIRKERGYEIELAMKTFI